MDPITQITETFVDADPSIIKEVLYFDGWSDYEETGGYLIFTGIDDTIQLVEYGYSVMVDDNTQYFLPREITKDEAAELMAGMDKAIVEMEKMISGG
jgi:hypothetical protein